MKIVVLGSGKMAQAIAHDLVRNTNAAIVVADIDKKNAEALAARLKSKRVTAAQVDVTSPTSLKRVLKGATATVGSTTYKHNLAITKACIAAKSHFVDLGGNIDVVKAQFELAAQAKKAGVTIVPDCGVAPGMVNILGYHWAKPFSRVDELKIRVGGLPQKPVNQLKYGLVFSVEGLINEYIEDCEVLVAGKKKLVPGMSGLEELSFAAPYDQLEAFYTSGGASTLPETLRGKVHNLDYKTIRYKGHQQYIKLMMDMGFFSSEPVSLGKAKVAPRAVTAQLFSSYLPHNPPDALLIRIAVRGQVGGAKVVRTYDCVDHFDTKTKLSAMQRTTGFPVAIVAAMLASGEISERGVVRQELAVPGEAFLAALAQRGISFIEAVERSNAA